MVQIGTRLNVADNSGAKEVMCLSIPGHGKKKYAYLGDMISGVVKKALPQGQIKRHQIATFLIVRTKKEKRRKNGSYIRFDDNAAVLVDKKGNPKGSRILGPIAREIKDIGLNKVASLATEMY